MQLTPVRCGNAECGIPLDEPPDLPFDQRIPCPRCGTVARCFEVGISLHVRATATFDMKIERDATQAQREAWLRGLTVEDFLAGLDGAVEIVWDHTRLKKMQVLHALRLFTMGEIGPERFIRALPVEYRPPYDDSGISPRDFEPLCSGIIRKD